MNTNPVIIYKINEHDKIIFTSGGWDSFALENDGWDVTTNKVLSRSLWDFIGDETTRQLYKNIIGLARRGKVMRFNFKCDSPGKIRFMNMTVLPENGMTVQFQSRGIKINERLSQEILDRKARRRESELINICGWCKALKIPESGWKSFDEGVSTLGLFEENQLPQLSHGICHSCFEEISELISRRKLST